jgi:hypothetical protein
VFPFLSPLLRGAPAPGIPCHSQRPARA